MNDEKPCFSCLLHILGAAVLAMAIFTFVLPPKAHAAAVGEAEGEGIKIIFTDEPCALAAVTNLPYAATWTEKGKVTKGCWGLHPQYPIVMTYWADRTVAVIPGQVVHAVTEAAL
jgi:hypothetical protein